jgi:hypothetical protein
MQLYATNKYICIVYDALLNKIELEKECYNDNLQ